MTFFEITKTLPDSLARLGVLNTAHGQIHTPAFIPPGTKTALKAAVGSEMKFLGAEAITADIFDLWLRPGDVLIQKSGGLHHFLGWRGPIFTDSGAAFLLRKKKIKDTFLKNVTVTDKGIAFQAGSDSAVKSLTTEQSIQIQLNLGSDIAQSFFHLPQKSTKVFSKLSFRFTKEWMERSKKQFDKVVGNSGQKIFAAIGTEEFLTAGSQWADLASSLNFDGYCIFGETDKKTIMSFGKILKPLEPDKPKQICEAGTPENLVRGVSLGIDLFTTSIPVDYAIKGKFFAQTKTVQGYSVLNLKSKKYEKNFGPVDNACDCYACLNYSASQIHYQFVRQENLGLRLGIIHNIKFYLNLMEKIRRAVKYESFGDMVKEYGVRYST